MTPQPANATRRAIVTGAGSGLGRAISLRLARDGWYLALVDLLSDRAEETLSLVRAAGGDGRAEQCDVTQRDAWATLRSRLETAWPDLDLLVNNAGVAVGGEVGMVSLDDWKWALDTNLLGAVNGCHTFVDWLKRNPRGASIINIASMAAIAQAPAMAPYNVSKAGVLSLSETLQAELGKGNVWVTVVCPKFFQTNLLNASRITGDGLREVATNSMQRARFNADDVADAAVRGMYRRKFYVIVPRRARLLWCLKRFIPNFVVHFMRKKYAEGLPEAVSPARSMLSLHSKTSPAWLASVEANLDEVLIDHAHCEKKAAGVAMNLIFAYVDQVELVKELSAIVVEELEHFRMVIDLLGERGVRFRRLKPSGYGQKLGELVRKQEPGKAVDRLLVAGLIEARSCERFALLKDHLSDRTLADFYAGLFESEARHHSTYVRLAKLFAVDAEVDGRLEELAAAEALVVANSDDPPRMHS